MEDTRERKYEILDMRIQTRLLQLLVISYGSLALGAGEASARLPTNRAARTKAMTMVEKRATAVSDVIIRVLNDILKVVTFELVAHSSVSQRMTC